MISYLSGFRVLVKLLKKIQITTKSCLVISLFMFHILVSWCCNVVVISTAQVHSRKSRFRFCAGLNPARGALEICRSSRPKVFCIKRVFTSFEKFTGKHLYQSLFFNEVADLRPVTLLKKRFWHRCFPVNFAKSLRTDFLQNTS